MLLQPPDQTSIAAAAAATRQGAESSGDRQEKDPDRELTALPGSDLSPLQPFELDECDLQAAGEGEASQLAERLKDRGNVLFKLGDTDAAAEMFARVLKTLEPTPVVGERQQWEAGGQSSTGVADCHPSSACCPSHNAEGPSHTGRVQTLAKVQRTRQATVRTCSSINRRAPGRLLFS